MTTRPCRRGRRWWVLDTFLHFVFSYLNHRTGTRYNTREVFIFFRYRTFSSLPMVYRMRILINVSVFLSILFFYALTIFTGESENYHKSKIDPPVSKNLGYLKNKGCLRHTVTCRFLMSL